MGHRHAGLYLAPVLTKKFCALFYVSCWVYAAFVELLVKCFSLFVLLVAIPAIIGIERLDTTIVDVSGGGLSHFILFVVVVHASILLHCDQPVFISIGIRGRGRNIGAFWHHHSQFKCHMCYLTPLCSFLFGMSTVLLFWIYF